jgi:Negative regulator of sigma E activity
MRVLPLLPLLLSGWFVVPAHADEAQDWLKRLGQAEQQHSYQGTFVYERNGSFLPTASGTGCRTARFVSG